MSDEMYQVAKDWKELYQAAIFETDKSKLSERIAYAEWALVLRARELFHSGAEHVQERQALDTAMCALRALRSATTCGEFRREPKLRNHDWAQGA